MESNELRMLSNMKAVVLWKHAACPFCGNEEREEFALETVQIGDWTFYRVVCSCGATGPTGMTPEEARTLYNKRIRTL